MQRNLQFVVHDQTGKWYHGHIYCFSNHAIMYDDNNRKLLEEEGKKWSNDRTIKAKTFLRKMNTVCQLFPLWY